jgi:thioesterase domain-containing protein
MERNSLATSVAASFADAAPATLDIVAAAWATALRRPAVDRDADFRALGLNANRAMRMMRDLWTETGRELPVNALLEYPTIRRLAAAIDDGRAFTAADLVLLSPARHDRPGIEPAPPLFLFGGFGGFLLDLTDLAKAIDAGCAVYGVGPAGADGATAPHLTYDGETAHARAAIKRVQPAGPYRLAGYSSGGIVALETARLMRAHGDAVAFVGLLDTSLDDRNWPVGHWLGFLGRKIRTRLVGALQQRRRDKTKPARPSVPGPPDIAPKRRGNQYTYRFRDTGAPDFPFYSPYWESHHTPLYSRLREATIRMRAGYRPIAYDGPVSVFKATIVDRLTLDPKLVWPPYLPRAEWIVLPGNHLTIIHGRHAARLASEIVKRL